jgi:hypothetical protein
MGDSIFNSAYGITQTQPPGVVLDLAGASRIDDN